MLTTQQALTRLKADVQLRGLSGSTLSSYQTHVKIFLESSTVRSKFSTKRMPVNSSDG